MDFFGGFNMLPDSMPELLNGLFCLGCEVWFESIERYADHKCSDYEDEEC